MATQLTHAFAAVSLGAAAFPGPGRWKRVVAGAVCSVLPDIDTIGYHLGVPYDHWAGHRGVTHSLLLAIALGILATAILCRGRFRAGVLAYLVIVTTSHGILDALTDGGLGTAFFLPFSGERFFLPFRPLAVAPLTVPGFFTSRGPEVLASEILWVWLPFALVALGVHLGVRRQEARSQG